MAGTVTVEEEVYGSLKKIRFVWTSDASGNADKATTRAYNGVIERLVTIPGSGGTQPTDDYDVELVDEDGVDVLMGAGHDRSNADIEQVLASALGCVANDTLTLQVSNAGNAKSGVVVVYLR